MRSAVHSHLEGSTTIDEISRMEDATAGRGEAHYAQVEANMLKYYFFGVTSRIDPSLDPKDVALHYSDEPGYGADGVADSGGAQRKPAAKDAVPPPQR